MIGAVILLFMLALAVCAPIITPESPYNIFSYDVANQNLSPRLTPAWYFALGTDTDGHPMVAQIAWGARVSLLVGFLSAFGATLIGVLVGAVAGYFSGWVDTVMMRVTDTVLTLPFLPLLILATDLWGQGHHLLPNALRPVIVATTLNVTNFIVVEAAIDFLGAGIKYPDASWGNILANAQSAFGTGNWWWPLFPGVFLVLTVLSINFMGDGLGDALDVRAKV
jgi:peptide/nickel transport system permease protein